MSNVTIITEAAIAMADDPRAAFTAEDMNLLTELAARCFKQHRWVAVARRTQTGPRQADALAVALGDGGWPSVTIERDASGTYSVRDPDDAVLASGPVLRDVLAAWDKALDLP